MKLEPRGKYAGVKVHLDGDECKALLSRFPDGYPILQFGKAVAVSNIDAQAAKAGMKLGTKLASKIRELMGEHPGLLNDRSDDEIRLALEHEAEQAKLKLDKLAKGEDWKTK